MVQSLVNFEPPVLGLVNLGQIFFLIKVCHFGTDVYTNKCKGQGNKRVGTNERRESRYGHGAAEKIQ